MDQGPIIKTKRLVLKALTISDASKLFEYRSKPEIYQYQSWKPKELEEATNFIVKATQGFNIPATWFQLGIFEDENMQLIGDIGLHFMEYDNNQMEIGFTISPQFQKKGFAQEAVREVVKYLCDELKKHRIIATADPRNESSIKLLERVGFRKEGQFKKSVFIDDQWEDEVLYAILDEEVAQWG